ncbi:hypothetical protein GCM10023088_57420 [Actinomadura verrucosospora]
MHDRAHSTSAPVCVHASANSRADNTRANCGYAVRSIEVTHNPQDRRRPDVDHPNDQPSGRDPVLA